MTRQFVTRPQQSILPHSTGRLRAVFVFAIAICSLLAVPANAAFPGRNGKIAFALKHGVAVMTVVGHRPHPIISEAGQPAWAPHGNRLAFLRTERAQNGGFTKRIWIARADGSHQRVVTPPGQIASDPSW